MLLRAAHPLSLPMCMVLRTFAAQAGELYLSSGLLTQSPIALLNERESWEVQERRSVCSTLHGLSVAQGLQWRDLRLQSVGGQQ